MSSKIHKQIEKNLVETETFYNAEVIKFPNHFKHKNSKNPDDNEFLIWKLYDKASAYEDGDQLSAVVGICFMIASLFFIGLYSTLF